LKCWAAGYDRDVTAILSTAALHIRPVHNHVDFTPLLTVLVLLLVLRVVLKVGLTWPVVVFGLFAGTALSWAIQVWGVLYPAAVAFSIAAIATAPLHRRGRGRSSEA
jgi:hypothetical protein